MESCCGLPIARKHPSRASGCAPNKAIGKIASFRPNQDCDPSTSEVMAVGDTWVQLLFATAEMINRSHIAARNGVSIIICAVFLKVQIHII